MENLAVTIIKGKALLVKTIRQKDIPLGKIKYFVVTGKLYRSNRRFSNNYNSFYNAMGINLWSGSVWAELDNGKRKLLKRVQNE